MKLHRKYILLISFPSFEHLKEQKAETKFETNEIQHMLTNFTLNRKYKRWKGGKGF